MDNLNIEELVKSPVGIDHIIDFFRDNSISIDDIRSLNYKLYRALRRDGYEYVYQICKDAIENSISIEGLRTDEEIRISECIVDYIYGKHDEIIEYCKDICKTEKCENICKIVDKSESCHENVPSDDMNSEKVRFGSFVIANDVALKDLNLSNRSYNSLRRAGYSKISDLIMENEESLSSVPNLGKKSIEEIISSIESYKYNNKARIDAFLSGDDGAAVTDTEASDGMKRLHVFEIIKNKEFHSKIYEFVKANDRAISTSGMSVRARNCLEKEGYSVLSDYIFRDEDSMAKIKGIGLGTLDEIMRYISDYLLQYEKQIVAFCNGDSSVILDVNIIKAQILTVYDKYSFVGLHLPEIIDELRLPDGISEEIVKRAIGQLISEKKLEYIDFRCYRTYLSFEKFVSDEAVLKDREKEFVLSKLDGNTLEAIAKPNGIQRERVRQIIKKARQKVVEQYYNTYGLSVFDEDYYSYFFSTYEVDKETCVEWLGISERTYHYLDMVNDRGKKAISESLDDANIDVGLKLKISNYINRNRIYVNGNWINKRRNAIEEVVLALYCNDEVSFDEFVDIYNRFLVEQEIEFDPHIYCTEEVIETRRNRLSEARNVLWKQSQRLRYYDIDGQDFTDLLETLNLAGYRDVEISTLKIFRDNLETMARYDIRDHYELHNLLRKIVTEGSYNNFRCERMPMVAFGQFDREVALYDIMANHAPISANDLADLIYDEYGYEQATTIGTYLAPLKKYYHNGIFSVDHKVMSSAHMEVLKAALTEDFYFIDDIKQIYRQLVDDADIETINSYNLKVMGFVVLSKYVLQNYPSLDAYFQKLLTENEVTDISSYKNRFCYIQMWSTKVISLKNSYDIVEFEPNKILLFKRLEKVGITKLMIREFCDAVYDFIRDGEYFSAKSLRNSGFESELYDLGFSDWFYANLLCADPRFSYNYMFKAIILYKGKKAISINSFVYEYLRNVGSIDVYELMNILENEYGCQLADKNIFMRGIYGIQLYYDQILQRLYFNEELYYKELDNDYEGL